MVVQDWPFRACTAMVRPTSSEGSPEVSPRQMEPPVAIVQAVGLPSWERGCIRLGGMGCSGSDEHAFVFEGALDGGADPGADVDVPFGAQSGQGVVDVWRKTEQYSFISHNIRIYHGS